MTRNDNNRAVHNVQNYLTMNYKDFLPIWTGSSNSGDSTGDSSYTTRYLHGTSIIIQCSVDFNVDSAEKNIMRINNMSMYNINCFLIKLKYM